MGFDAASHVQDDPISQLANAHFPELNAFDEAAHGGGVSEMGGMTNLDFMSLGGEGGDGGWNAKEWHGALESVGGDLDGFPVDGGFGMGFDGKF